MDTDKQGRLLAYGAGLALFAWFVFAIRGGLDSQLSGDDVMNLHYYWSRPWSALLKANMFFWSSFFRPAGGLFYRCVYALWGLDPLPFRIVELVLLCVNFGLLAAVVHQLTGSRWCALVALLAIGIHPTFSTIYVDNGSIFDILAYTCCWGAFAWYVHLRQKGRLPGVPGMALLLCLFAAALDSKEISVALPAQWPYTNWCGIHPPIGSQPRCGVGSATRAAMQPSVRCSPWLTRSAKGTDRNPCSMWQATARITR